MNNNEAAIITTERKDLIQFDEGKVGLIKRTIAPTATPDELELFLHQCRRTGLDPLARQIYFQKYTTKDGPRVSIITGIDGYRLVADRTGLYAGSDEPQFEGRQTQTRYQESRQVPAKASVTIWKIVAGKRVPFSASAYWDEYWPGDKSGHMWFKMPHVMLGKVAEAQALRKAFPADLSGVYTHEEMDQAGWQELDEEPQPDPEPPTNGSQPTGKPAPGANNLADVLAEYGNAKTVTLLEVRDTLVDVDIADNVHHAWNIIKLHDKVAALDNPSHDTRVSGEGAAGIVQWAATRKDEPVEEGES